MQFTTWPLKKSEVGKKELLQISTYKNSEETYYILKLTSQEARTFYHWVSLPSYKIYNDKWPVPSSVGGSNFISLLLNNIIVVRIWLHSLPSASEFRSDQDVQI